MPALNAAVELRACIEYAIVVFLVVDWARDAVSEHAFCQAGQGVDWVLAQESCCARSVLLCSVVALRCAELVEFVLGYV